MVSKPYMVRFAIEMKALAKLRGLAIGDIAESVGLARATVFQHFNGSTRPKVIDIVRYLEWSWDPYFGSDKKFVPKNSRKLSQDEVERAVRANITALHALMNGEVR